MEKNYARNGMKKTIALLLMLAMCFALAAAAAEDVTIPFTKAWSDADDQDGLRPDTLAVSLMSGNEKLAELTVTEAGGWVGSFTVPESSLRDASGNLRSLTVMEESVPGYTASVTDPALREVETTFGSEWEKIPAGNNREISQPVDQDTVLVFNKGNDYLFWTYRELTKEEESALIEAFKEDNNNSETTFFSGYGNQTEGVTVTENKITFAESSVWSMYFDGSCVLSHIVATGASITNTHTLETVSVTVKKVWNDAGNQDGKRPASLTVTLSNGESVTLNEGNGWEATINNLPVYANGQPITYTWTEADMPEGYALTNTSVNGTVTTLTNGYQPETTSATVKKVWNDAGNQDGKRPASLTVTLSNGESVTLNEGNGWEATINNLPVYANGQPITYSWTEADMPEGYALTNTSVNGTITTLTNSYTPETTSVSGIKTWNDADNQDGKRPESITIRLYADGLEVNSAQVTAQNGWAWSFVGLSVYKNGTPIVYTISEDVVEGYETTIEGYNVTNSYVPGTVSVSGVKTWNDADNQDGKRPESITVTLLKNGKPEQTITVTVAEGWAWSFANLPEYEAGELIEYGVAEEPVPGYTTVVDGYNITNSYDPQKISINVLKTWMDENNRYAVRPTEVTVILYADGEMTNKRLTLNAGNGWKGTFENLDVCRDGAQIVYTVDEKYVQYYAKTITGSAADGFVITNRMANPNLLPPIDPDLLPKTGDSSMLMLWMGAMLTALLGMTVMRRRAKND